MKNDLFESAPVPKAYLTLALPVVMGMVVNLLYNMVDTYFIALTGNTDLVAGISLMSPVFTLMIAFGDIWGLGGSSLISRKFGEKKYDEAGGISAFSFWASIAFGLCVTAVMLILRTPILSLLGAQGGTWKYACDYYTWIAIGASAQILGLVPNNILRTEGLAGSAMAGSVLGSVVNIILDPIFIFGLQQGAAGAAIATVLGNVAADIFYVRVMMKKTRHLTASPRRVKVTGEILSGVLVIGIPASVTNIMQSLMVTVTNHYLLPYGTECVAAMGIALKVYLISMLILIGFAFGGQPLIGYCYGAHDKERLKKVLKFAYGMEGICALVFTAVMSAAAPVIIRIFMDDPVIVSNGSAMLRCLQAGLVFMSMVLVSTCVCQSFGKAIGAFILSVSRQGVVYCLVIALLSALLGLKGVMISQACSDVITAAIAALIVRKYMKEVR